MLSLDLFPALDATSALEMIRCWSLALTPFQKAALQAKMREGVSADAQVALRVKFREQNARIIVEQFFHIIQNSALNILLQHEEHLPVVVNKMRAALDSVSGLFSHEISHKIKKRVDNIWHEHLLSY